MLPFAKKTPFCIWKGSRPRCGLPSRVLAWSPLPWGERAALLPVPSPVRVGLRRGAPLGPALWGRRAGSCSPSVCTFVNAHL